MTKINLFWFRRDLRLEDNIGLFHALKDDLPVLPLFIFDQKILDKLPAQDQRVQFIHDTLSEMKSKLNELGSDLLIKYGSPKEVWESLICEFEIQKVYTNEDYEPYAIKRDKSIADLLAKRSIEFLSYKDQCIFAKDDVLKADGKPYTVYTPFKNKWYDKLTPSDLASVHCKKYYKNFLQTKSTKIPSLKEMGFEKVEVKNKIKSIKKSIIEHYEQTRDFPGIQGTTQLGLHLRFGTVSVRKCAQIGYHHGRKWLDELVWREFFMQILYHFPHVEKKCFRDKYEKIKWVNNKKQFKKWCEGQTGYPLVDAGMRELNETGFMHNRVRMLVGSFLVKHLLIDWRWGERYFAEKLLDFDLSANTGNWQWVAGTGCDAAPYFRIFNPETQLKKFDKDLKYVKKWVPEYGTSDYPEPMVDHRECYQRALATYKEAIQDN